MTQRPCIITIHGVGLARNRIEEKAQKALLRFCDLIICQRKTVLEKMISWGYKQDKVRMLEGGAIDTKKYKPRTTKYINHHLKITFVGRLDDFRGPELLLDAIPIVIRSYSDTIFQFVGDGPKKIYLIKKAKKMNIEKYVRFLGTRNDVNNILENSDIYVAVSPYENLSSLALFEAMSTGLAIVATDVGETKNLVQKKETLLLAKPTPNSIAEQLLRLLYDQKLRLTLGKNARELIIEEYSLDKLVASHEKVYMNVLQSRYLSPMRERN
jgi:glycosyltransferase involved in cell wall biosynthesis